MLTSPARSSALVARSLPPELLQVVEALARVQEERDHRAATPAEAENDDTCCDLRPL